MKIQSTAAQAILVVMLCIVIVAPLAYGLAYMFEHVGSIAGTLALLASLGFTALIIETLVRHKRNKERLAEAQARERAFREAAAANDARARKEIARCGGTQEI